MDPPRIPEGSLRIPLELPRAPQGFPQDAPRLPPGSPRDSLGVARQILIGNATGGPGAQKVPGARMGAKQDNVGGGGGPRAFVERVGSLPEEFRKSPGRVLEESQTQQAAAAAGAAATTAAA
jgi:hypothetical protein